MLCALGALGSSGCNVDRIDNNGPPPQTVPIRRLTNAEYIATVGDLFPGYTLPEMIFVPDPKVLGFLNLSSSQTGSLVRMEQYESVAQGIAQAVTADPTTLTSCDATQDEAGCVGPWLADFGKRAYRRPLTDAEQSNLMGLLARDADTLAYPERLAIVIQAVLLSPKFLFRPEIGAVHAPGQVVPLTSWEVATRLSYFLTGTIPDDELAGAADAGLLMSQAEVVKQARRLMTSARAQSQLVKFHTMWLGSDTTSALAKDEKAYPTFNPLLAYYMAKETDQFLRNTIFEEGGTFGSLMLSDHTWVNRDLADFYGIEGPDDEHPKNWVRAQLDTSKRVGLLTQASLLATMAKQDRTDPVRRGKFVYFQLLCKTVAPPSPQIVAMFKPLDLSQTAREQFTEHRTNPVCAQCHDVLDPLGLPFEHYDGIGQWRDQDQYQDIDVTGEILGKPFDGVPQMAALIADLPEARDCYIKEWMRFANGRLDADQAYVDWLMTRFSRNTRIVDLVAAVVGSDAFRQLAPAEGAP